MRRLISIFLSLIGITFGSVLLARTAAAESDAACRAYARNAVGAFHQSQQLHCGFTNARWHPNEAAHYNWCRGAPAAWLRSEEGFRANQLRVCRREPKAVECNKYAIEAASAQSSNLSGRCGFTGARWQANQDVHLSWCLSLPSFQAANSEINIRFALLGVCGRSPEFLRCDGYARQAVEQANEAVARGCRFGGQPPGRWTTSYEAHLTWCIGVPAGASRSEASQRQGPLSQCRTTNPIGGSPAQPPEACAISVTVRNRTCLNLDGTPSSISPGSMSAPGCGGNQNIASQRAKLNFAANHSCLSDGNAPSPGCCTYSQEATAGCLCQ